MRMGKAVLIYSGGLDSTVLLYWLLDKGYDVVALGINYGQRHAKELDAAKAICAHLKVDYKIADLSAIKPFLAGSSQTDASVEVPEGHYAAQSMKLTVVPNRNMIMLSVAIAYAITEKADAVAFAAHSGDHAIYPDCRPTFVHAMNDVAQEADWHKVQVLAPFLPRTKQSIVKVGAKLHVPMDMTWSCYKGGELHCGKCGTCVERIEAFDLAEIPDLTKYEVAPVPLVTPDTSSEDLGEGQTGDGEEDASTASEDVTKKPDPEVAMEGTVPAEEVEAMKREDEPSPTQAKPKKGGRR